jgi:pimeloyl-ACP methyl ester carboxylesterase
MRGRHAAHIQPGLPLWREAFAGLDWLSLRLSSVFHGHGVPRGDGGAVVTVPGMLCTDAMMIELRAWLRRIGYRPYAAGIGRIARCPDDLTGELLGTIDRAADETSAPVRLIGHSLGGLLARGAAMQRAGTVSHVITLGSPVSGVRAHPAIVAAGALTSSGCDVECVRPLQANLPPRVRETSIYTKTDGVVDWRTCVRPAPARSIEVPGTHAGLVFNPDAYRALAQALAEPVQAAVRALAPQPAVEAPYRRAA